MAADKLARWGDAELGELVWDELAGAWKGSARIGGRDVALSFETTLAETTRADQEAAIARNRDLLLPLREAEPRLRRQAAGQIAAAVGEQSDAETARAAHDGIEQLAAALQLLEVSLHDGGELHYRDASGRFFPGATITIYFGRDLSFGDAEVY